MKRFTALFLIMFLLIIFSCRNETKKNLPAVEKKQEKNIEIIKRTESLKAIDPVKDVVKENSTFLKLYESLKQDTYSIDELVDLTEKDLELFKKMKINYLKSKIDTPAVKSRLLLTEINLKRLDFLLHKKKIETDTIRKTLDEITRNLNATVDKIRLYHQSVDEFQNILTKDSLMQAKKDSMTSDKKEIIDKLNKLKSQKIKFSINRQ